MTILSKAMLAAAAAATLHGGGNMRAVEFPDAPDGRRILAVDLHTHSVFSDGAVWPVLRMEEAVRDGLDAVAVTEHLEHQPHSEDIPHPDRNRSYEIASEAVEEESWDIIVINGAEITRDRPLGHVNGVFLKDANALLTDGGEAPIRAANAQDAFVFWNHPHWLPQAPDGVARIEDIHKRLIAEGLLHGVEVANGTLDGYSVHALGIALEYGLTILGTSDIHGLTDWTHDAGHGGHRPMTLVLTDEKTKSAIKEALFQGATVSWSHDDLAGREENVRVLVQACLELEPGLYPEEYTVLPVTLRNLCPVRFTLKNTGEKTFQNIGDVFIVPPHGEYGLQVRMMQRLDDVELSLTVLNSHIRPREHLEISLNAHVPGE